MESVLLNQKFWIWTKVEWVLPCPVPRPPTKYFWKIFCSFCLIILTNQQTERGENITSLSEVIKHSLNHLWEIFIWCVLGVLWDLCHILQPSTWGQEISYCCIPWMVWIRLDSFVSVNSTFKSGKNMFVFCQACGIPTVEQKWKELDNKISDLKSQTQVKPLGKYAFSSRFWLLVCIVTDSHPEK